MGKNKRKSHGKPTLPPGWKCKKDREKGAVYYYHKASGKTQWDIPGDQNDNHGKAGKFDNIKSKLKDIIKGNGELKDHRVQKIPPGWKCRKDQARGTVYYYHKATGRSQWEFPGDRYQDDDHGKAKPYDIEAQKPLKQRAINEMIREDREGERRQEERRERKNKRAVEEPGDERDDDIGLQEHEKKRENKEKRRKNKRKRDRKNKENADREQARCCCTCCCFFGWILGLVLFAVFAAAVSYSSYILYKEFRVRQNREAFLKEINLCRQDPAAYIKNIKETYQTRYQLTETPPEIHIRVLKLTDPNERGHLWGETSMIRNESMIVLKKPKLAEVGDDSEMTQNDFLQKQFKGFTTMAEKGRELTNPNTTLKIANCSPLTAVDELADDGQVELTIRGSSNAKSLAAAILLMEGYCLSKEADGQFPTRGRYDNWINREEKKWFQHLFDPEKIVYLKDSLQCVTLSNGVKQYSIVIGKKKDGESPD